MRHGATQPRLLDRYVLFDAIAAGGMATVHFGRLVGPAGFSRTVAIKRLHEQFASDPEFVTMFLDEARVAARIRHPNVVATLDVVARESELFVVMDYVHGDTLAKLIRACVAQEKLIPVPVAVSVMSGVLSGLQAAHEATSEHGTPLGIVHRDVSPQNVIVGVDGLARVVDFGIAKAANRLQTTREGQLKGKLSYMAPEQLQLDAIDARTDVYAASVVLWEMLTSRRLFAGDQPGYVVTKILHSKIPPPSSVASEVSTALDAIVLKGLARSPSERFQSAHAMAEALQNAVTGATALQVGAWVREVAANDLSDRASRVAEIESQSSADRHGAAVASIRELAFSSSGEVAPPTPSDVGTASALPVTSASRLDSLARAPKSKTWLFVAAALVAGVVAIAAFVLRPTHATSTVPTSTASAFPAAAVSASSAPTAPQASAEPPQSSQPSAAPVASASAPKVTPSSVPKVTRNSKVRRRRPSPVREKPRTKHLSFGTLTRE